MNTPFNWHAIRTVNNSQNEGFEEFVCQLAFREFDGGAGSFRRVGKPDGGKECFWNRPGHGLSMWQAKFFTSSLAATQWKQVEKSVKTAIDNHQELKDYYLCFALDLPDTKAKGKVSLLQKYREKVKDWQQYALNKGMEISFHYWGSSELIRRISKRENEGMKYFWFHQEEFLDSWFDHKNKEAINALGARYSTDLNVELEISQLFAGMAQDPFLKREIGARFKNAASEYLRFERQPTGDDMQSSKELVVKHFSEFRKAFYELQLGKGETIRYESLCSSLDNVLKPLNNILTGLYEMRYEAEKGKVRDYNRPFADQIRITSDLRESISELRNFFYGDLVRLANNPYLLLVGDAGAGKSHLLADAVNQRKQNEQVSLLLLGENFTSKEAPWTQFLHNQLRKSHLDEFVFLGALNAKAESMGSRIILFIDALNEGEGKSIWPRNLKTFIETIQQYKWLGLVLSLRSSYEKLIAPEESISDELILRRIHCGFADHEYTATKLFFQYYDIVLPSSPVLNPEFHNPLFLKLLCTSVKAMGRHQVPEGYDGITKIINLFLDAANSKLSGIDELNYDENKRLVHKTVFMVVGEMVNKQQDFLLYDEADVIADALFTNVCGNREPFLRRLLSEGIFNVDLRWDANGEDYQVVYLAYQRFQDHLYVAELLKQYLNKEKPEESFTSGPLWDIIKNEMACLHNSNLVEALLIQLPETTGKELFTIVPSLKNYYSVNKSWIDSLLWRKPETIEETANEYVNEYILDDEELFGHFLMMVLSAGMKPNFISMQIAFTAFL